MKKVMLVDDEIVIRENIRECIDWEKEGLQYCGDASDGEIALPMIEEWRPDILITDIKMPFMDGIELSTIVRQRFPDTKIIILSGHDEFNYARTALRIGVDEYILKPASSADLISLLHSVSRKIDRERREKQKQVYSYDKLLGDLCGGLIASDDAEIAAAALSLPLLSTYYAAVIWDMRCADHSSPHDEAILLEAESIIEEIAKTHGDLWRYKRSRAETVWLVRGDKREAMASRLEQLQRLAESESTLPLAVSIGVGGIQERPEGIHKSFLEAEEDRNLRRLNSQNKNALWVAARETKASSFLDRSKFLEFLKIGTPPHSESFIGEISESLRGIDWNSSLYGYYVLKDLTLETLHEAKRVLRLPEVSESMIGELQQKIMEIRDWEQCRAYLRLLIDKFWIMRVEASNKYGDMIEKAKEFMRERFADDGLSLQDAANHVCVSSSHLSKVFSHETGQTFIEYLTQTRIRKAMELLQTTSEKTYEIAFQVGYNDSHYFSNLFKRTTGMTPRDFRRQGGSGGKCVEKEADEVD
ncbi:response regulator [Cohnella lupini]|uniref:Two-component system response regulator YesN n=1 Tax=Cohnella lupini TaxID=1294267 RepID=A0A3D9HZM8_9BACL|nr:response regulator [Cohnella lupini]RED54933.1 two-component system response regulator YesN [Cohnella lupini]